MKLFKCFISVSTDIVYIRSSDARFYHNTIISAGTNGNDETDRFLSTRRGIHSNASGSSRNAYVPIRLRGDLESGADTRWLYQGYPR